MWLDLCFAVILPALGSAIVFDIGASTGGTDILAMILKRRTTLEIGRALLLVDIGIVTIAAFLYGPRVGLYCVLGLFAKTLVVDKAIESIHLRQKSARSFVPSPLRSRSLSSSISTARRPSAAATVPSRASV